MTDSVRLRVAVDAPQHTGLAAPLDYRSQHLLAPGTLVRVPLGKREVSGVVWADDGSEPLAGELREISLALDVLPPLGGHWRALASTRPLRRATASAWRAPSARAPCMWSCRMPATV